MNWKARAEKQEGRIFALDQPGKRKRLFVALPGWDVTNNDGCLCVKQGIKSKLLVPGRTKIIAVEREPHFWPHIDAELTKLGFRHRLHRGDIATLQFAPDERVDGAFLDFLGTLDERTARWLATHFSAALCRPADVAFTFAYHWRNSPFMDACQRAFSGPLAPYWREAEKHYGVQDDYIMVTLLVLRTVFRGFLCEFRRPIKYRDGVPAMVVYRFDRLRALPQDQQLWPTLDAVLAAGKAPKAPKAAPTPPVTKGNGATTTNGATNATNGKSKARTERQLVEQWIGERRRAEFSTDDLMVFAKHLRRHRRRFKGAHPRARLRQIMNQIVAAGGAERLAPGQFRRITKHTARALKAWVTRRRMAVEQQGGTA